MCCLLVLRSFRDPPPSASPPVLHPKTPSMTADMALGSSPSKVIYKPTLSATAELGRLESEEYVTTDVFRIDRQTQEEIDVSFNLITDATITHLHGDFIWLIFSSIKPHSPITTRIQ